MSLHAFDRAPGLARLERGAVAAGVAGEALHQRFVHGVLVHVAHEAQVQHDGVREVEQGVGGAGARGHVERGDVHVHVEHGGFTDAETVEAQALTGDGDAIGEVHSATAAREGGGGEGQGGDQGGDEGDEGETAGHGVVLLLLAERSTRALLTRQY